MTWERRLQAVIERWRTVEMSWSRNCAMFAADCVEAVSGVDPIADLRGQIVSAKGCAEALRAGDGSFASVVSARLGQSINPLLARRGDIVGLQSPGLVLGVCVGSRCLFLDDVGLVSRSLGDVTIAWRVARG